MRGDGVDTTVKLISVSCITSYVSVETGSMQRPCDGYRAAPMRCRALVKRQSNRRLGAGGSSSGLNKATPSNHVSSTAPACSSTSRTSSLQFHVQEFQPAVPRLGDPTCSSTSRRSNLQLHVQVIQQTLQEIQHGDPTCSSTSRRTSDVQPAVLGPGDPTCSSTPRRTSNVQPAVLGPGDPTCSSMVKAFPDDHVIRSGEVSGDARFL